ncbi:MAG TPA: ABC transporter ATP-binding protein [Candidatus Dormibacteraeota bacterium]|nr:ABC transporter ATP-binding protein [Candidatus Dormibacteraeota bacterium]
MGVAIETDHLTKKYGSFLADDGIDLTVEQGELFGFIGPNGAGKTTAIRMLSGLLQPSSGRGQVLQFDIIKDADEIRSRIGLVPENSNTYPYLPVKYNLEFMAKLYRVPRKSRAKVVHELLDYFALTDKANDLAINLSKGLSRRLIIACALVHDPEILFLDELTSGLDVQSTKNILAKVKELNERGRTIFLTAHRMQEIEQLCDRVAIINHGKIVACGSVDSLRTAADQFDIIELAMYDPVDKELIDWLQRKHSTDRVHLSKETNMVSVEVQDAEISVPVILEMAAKLGAVVKSVRVKEATLEDVFIKLTEKPGEGEVEVNA